MSSAYNGKQNPKGQNGKNKNYDIIYRRLLKDTAQRDSKRAEIGQN